MIAIISRTNAIARWFDREADIAIPTLARVIFIGVLLGYFWNSGLTKLENFPFGLSLGSYFQIFPRAMEAAGYDISQLSFWHSLVVWLGTMAELALPVLIALGLLTRLAALGMIIFIIVQSLTDIIGHGATEAVGAWFDHVSGSLILDQRALWIFLLVVLVLRGAGPISLDRILLRGTRTGEL